MLAGHSRIQITMAMAAIPESKREIERYVESVAQICVHFARRLPLEHAIDEDNTVNRNIELNTAISMFCCAN